MFTRLTNTSSIIKGVLVVAAVALLLPVYVAYGQPFPADPGPLDPGSPAQNPPGGGQFGGFFTPDDLDLGSGFTPVSNQSVNQNAGSQSTPGGGAAPRPTQDPVAAAGVGADEAFADAPFTRWIYLFVVNFFGWLVFAGGYILDFAVNNFVINFGLEFNTSGVGESVNELWSLVRDFFNILFIFGFIWIGFQMILDSGNSRAKQTLVSLIMAALLVNFSLFISKFVVDFSNRLATEVAIAAFPLVTEDGAAIADASEVSISRTFFAHLGISETLRVPTAVANGGSEPWAFIFGSAIFYLVAAFVFAAGGIMLIIRFVALSIFMVLSPFMFLGWVFPGMQGWTNKYWTGFLGRAFYAPVYIILLFFAGTILQRMFGEGGSSEVVGGTGGLLSAVTNNEDNLILILGPFILSGAFMLAAVIVAGKMSADGAGGVMKVGGNIVQGGRRRLKNGAIGVGRFGARNTAGLGALATSAASDKIANSRAYRRLNANLGNNIIGRNVAAGMDATLAAGGRASIAGSATAAERRKAVADRQNQINTTQNQLSRAETAETNLNTARANADINDPAQRAARADAVNAIGGQVRRMTDEEVLALDEAILNDPIFAQHLTDAHITALRNSGTYNNNQMRTITTARDQGGIATISETLDSTNASANQLNDALDQLAQTIQRMPIDRLQGFSADAATANASNSLLNPRVAANLTEQQIEGLQNSGRFTATQIRDIRTAKNSGLEEIANGTGTTISNNANPEQAAALSDRRELLFQGSAQQAGQLPASVFANPTMAQYITPAALQQRVRNGLSTDEVTHIETNITNYLNGLGTARERTMWQNWTQRTTEGARFNF